MNDDTHSQTPSTAQITTPPQPGLYDIAKGRGVRGLVFQNVSKEGRYFSTVKYSRSYLDRETGELKFTDTLTHREQSQMGYLVHEVSRMQMELDSINASYERTQQQAPEASQEGQLNLATQRDEALSNAKARNKNPSPDQTPRRGHEPEL